MVSKPVMPPWNDSSKNIVRDIVINSDEYLYTVLSAEGFNFNKRNVFMEYVYREKGRYSPSFDQNKRVFLRLLKEDRNTGIYHFFFTPNSRTSMLLKMIKTFRKMITIQSICSTPPQNRGFKNLFFADYNVALSDYTHKILIDNNIKNAVRIYPGTEITDLEENICDREEIMKSFGLSGEQLVLFSGDYEFSGAHEKILSIINIVTRERAGLKFIFACRPKTEKSIRFEKKIRTEARMSGFADKILFLGEVENIKKLISVSDIVIFPSKYHHHKMDIPLFLLEAIERGKPLIVSDIKPFSEIMKGEIGILTDQDSKEELSNAILLLSGNRNMRMEMGKAAREVAVRYFNSKTMAKEYEKLYENIVKSGDTANLKSYYDIESRTYEKIRENQYHDLINQIELKMIKKYLKYDMKVLEAGCGTGMILDGIRNSCKMLIGIDLSAGMLKIASEKSHKVIQGSVLEMPFEKDFFDMIYSVKVLAHIKDIKAAVNETVRIAKPGGIIILEFYNAFSIRGLRWLIKKLLKIRKNTSRQRETDIYTRYDNLWRIKKMLPDNVRIKEFSSIITFIPFASMMNFAFLSAAICRLEQAAVLPFNCFGGFIIFVLEKL